jgi:hypothetical protein
VPSRWEQPPTTVVTAIARMMVNFLIGFAQNRGGFVILNIIANVHYLELF